MVYLVSSKSGNFQSCTICLQPSSCNPSSLANVWMHVCLIWPHSCFSFIYYIYCMFISVRYGAPYNTEFKLIVENLSSRASWQVRIPTAGCNGGLL